MEAFLVESFLSRAAEFEVIAARTRTAAETLSKEGVKVKYIRSIFAPGDETCFHVIEADSIENVAAVSRRASLAHTRIVAAKANDDSEGVTL